MKDRKHVAWLYEQLPTLVSEGVLASEAAARLHQRYGVVEAHLGRRWAMMLFSILGATLIGSGLILLLAYNWQELSRPMRALIALAPLLIAQMLAAWVLWSKTESTAWREGVGTFLTLSIGIAIALISQTYHLGGDLGDFLLAWGVLGLPTAYLLRATVPALLYIIDITFWTSTVHARGLAGARVLAVADSSTPLCVERYAEQSLPGTSSTALLAAGAHLAVGPRHVPTPGHRYLCFVVIVIQRCCRCAVSDRSAVLG